MKSPPVGGRRAGVRGRGVSQPARPRVLFLGKTYAGWQTRFLNLQAHMSADERIEADFRAVTGWRAQGRLERMGFVPAGLRGRARSTLEAAPVARFPRPDATWSSAGEVLFPYLWAQAGPLRRPLVLEVDWTLEQQEEMAREYFGREPRRGAALAFAQWRERMVWRATTAFVAMSHWAAGSLIRQGVPSARVHVIHPGLNLEWWSPGERDAGGGRMRLLFVGGDFARKGGTELLEVFAQGFSSRCELDVVTTAAIAAPPG
ncbi:MAG: glycosyltransferase, partial [Gemmatimonadales bacterium]